MRFQILIMGAILVFGSAWASGAPWFGRSGVRKANESLHQQGAPKVSHHVLERVATDNIRVHISLSKQRAYLMINNEVAIDTPISSGKSAGMTPTGSFRILDKTPDHRSSLYGDFVDSQGRVVRAGVSSRIDSAPSGTRFQGSPMLYFMRFHGGVGMHIGLLPGYPASHGCVRMPAAIAPMFYQRVRVGTPVVVAY